MKKSIALFITILFLISIITIINLILKEYEKYSDSKSFIYISENSLIIKNTLKTLFQTSENIKNSQDLQKIFITFPLSSKNGYFRVIYKITPVFNKIDINSYLENNKINKNIDFFISNILNYYRIQDPIFFKNLLLDTIDSDTKEREGRSEIILIDPFFQNGRIYSYEQFQKIENYYFKITNDKNIYKIPWKKFIFFGNGSRHILACGLLNKQTAEFLGLVFDNQPTCENILTKENNQTVKNFDIIKFHNQNSFWINVNINYFYNKIHNSINIIYDIHNKKAISIESHPVY